MRLSQAFRILLVSVVAIGGCARLPYTTRVVHEDQRVAVKLQQEIKPAGYTHPVLLTPGEMATILRGFSLREQKSLPLRWFAEEAPPKSMFREDEIQVLSGRLVEALQKAGPEERVHFELFAPGMNPAVRRDVTAGWIAIRDSYLYLTTEYFHVQVPTRKSDPYDYNYPTPPPVPGSYLLYFEPGRFWVTDQRGERALDFQQFLKSAPLSGAGGATAVSPAGTP